MLENNVLESLSIEWDTVVAFFKRCIARRPKIIISTRIYKFGHEQILVGSQIYRDFPLSYLIEISLFGKKYCLLNTHKIVLKTKNKS